MAVSDAEKFHSGQMNRFAVSAAEAHDGGVRVVFIGNSITIHGVLPEIGWHNEWGMAAGAAEKDYAHLVIRGIERETGRRADVRIRNLADFERDFRNYDFEKLRDLIDFNPDYLVVALGENVAELESEAERHEFRDAFKKLLRSFLSDDAKPNTVVRGVFWPNEWKDAMMSHAASDLALPFVKADLAGDESMMALDKFEHDGVRRHPGDKGMAEIARRVLEGFFPKDSGYEAWADGQRVFVRPILVSAMPFNQWNPGYQRPADQTEVAGMVNIESDGPTEFRVRAARSFQSAKVRPLRAGVTPRIEEQEIVFTLPRPGQYVLELDGYHRPLEIFVNPKRDFSSEIREATMVFGPGLHEPVAVKLRSHDRVYIDKDAVVMGTFQAENAEDIKIFGNGVICGSRNRRPEDWHCFCISPLCFIHSRDIVVDGPVVLDAAGWCVVTINSSNVEFANLKITGAWRYNTDGIDICNSQHVHIHDCFVHSFDDTIVLKGLPQAEYRKYPEEDIRVERCICWCGWGRTLECGLETWASRYRGIVFEDCDLIHNNATALSVHLGGCAAAEDIAFRNIRIEYDASELSSVLQTGRDQRYAGEAPCSGNWLEAGNQKMFTPGGDMYSAEGLGFDPTAEPYGTFRNLTVETIDITVDEGAVLPGIAMFAVPGSLFGAVSISDVRINGILQPFRRG